MTDLTVMTLRFQTVFCCSHGSKRRISAFALWSEQNSFFIPLVTTKTWLELEPMLVISRTLVSLEKQNSFVCTNSCQFGYQNHFWGAGLYKASRYWRRLTTLGEGTPLYKPYRYVPPHLVAFLRRFGLKTGNHTLCPFWSGIGCGFKGNYGKYERLYRFNSKLVRRKEKYANSKWIE